MWVVVIEGEDLVVGGVEDGDVVFWVGDYV